MPDNHEYIFVYGTLMPGHGNYRRIEQFVHDSKTGTIRGVLVDLGPFPALIKGEGIVKGMLLTVGREALEITDFIEGYRPDRKGNLYLREEVEVELNDGSIKAWTYLYADCDRIRDQHLLKVGDVEGVPIYEWSAS